MPPIWQQVRWQVLGLLFLVTVINFVDRNTLGVVGPVLLQRFHLTASEFGTIGSAFMFGMLVGEFPMGWIMDRFGVRRGFSFSVAWWSLAAGLHAIARSALQFSIFRFWMGTGECGNYSGGVKLVSEWFPVREKAFAVGVFNAGSMIGTLIATPLIVFLTLRFGWQVAFLAPASLGFIWVVLWRYFYRPLAEHPRVTAAEAHYIRGGQRVIAAPPPARVLISYRQGWGLILCRFLVGPVIQFYWLWLPIYLNQSRGLSLTVIGWSVTIPYLFGDLGSVGGGLFAGFLMRRGFSLSASRLITMWTGAACCAMSIGVARASSAAVAIAFICLVMFGHTWLSANMFAAISDIYPEAAAARMTALTGIAGGISGVFFPKLTGILVQRISFTPVFFMAAFMPAAGVFCLGMLARRFQRIQLQEHA